MRKIITLGGAAVTAFALAGCGLLGVEGATGATSASPPVVITSNTPPSALLAVLDGPASGAALSSLVSATARPREDLMVLQGGAPPATVATSVAPPASAVTVAGMPAAPSGNATSYQAAQYASRLKHWHGEIAAARRAETARTRLALAAWLSGVGLRAKTDRLANSAGLTASLAAESSAAASALVVLAQERGNAFGLRRVILLYTDDLTSKPPTGELSGDTVFVVTGFLPTAAVASAAQANLLAAGAVQAAVLGPEATGTQLAALVAAGLSQHGMHESVSAPVLFANNSAALTSGTISRLTALLPKLRGAGVTVVINGFASTPGTGLANYTLSFSRAAMVASFFEANGVPTSSLVIVGHGASDLVATGTSGANRRVTVVIEKSS